MSFSSEWQGVKDAWNDSKSPASPGARFGLLFDPTRYVADAFGKGDEYRNAITKSGDWMNERLSGALGTSDRGGWAANKPVSTLGLLAAGYFTGGGMLGGGGAGGSGAGSNLGIFSNGGVGGMGGVGGGNAGALANAGGISGGAGMGSATAGGGFLGSLQQNPQQYLQMMQGMGGQQQQQEQPRPLQPVVIRGRVFWI